MRYKLVGWLNLVFGFLGLIYQVAMLFFVYPKLNSLYQDLDVQLPFTTKLYPFITLISIVVLAAVTAIGAKLITDKTPQEKLYKLGLIALLAFLFLASIFTYTAVYSLVKPLYDLTSNF